MITCFFTASKHKQKQEQKPPLTHHLGIVATIFVMGLLNIPLKRVIILKIWKFGRIILNLNPGKANYQQNSYRLIFLLSFDTPRALFQLNPTTAPCKLLTRPSNIDFCGASEDETIKECCDEKSSLLFNLYLHKLHIPRPEV